MYHTNGTRADITTTERKPPTIADIVREKTDDGARIIDFFLDLMEGRVDGAKLCHRIDAAKQLVKYGSKDAADFIAGLRGEPCGHCESRRRGPRSRKDESPAAGPLHPPAHLAPDFLTLLTEDFLTVLSAVDEDLMIKLVRAQTAHGDTVVEFLYDVMRNRVEGFRPSHRIAAARELISHILRDEHPHPAHPEPKERVEAQPVVPAHTTVVPAKSLPRTRYGAGTHPRPRQADPEPVEGALHTGPAPLPAPSPSTGEGRGEGDSDIVGADPRVRPLPAPSPSTGEGRGEGDSDIVGADPRVRPLPTPSPSTGEADGPGDSAVVPAHTTVVPAKSLPRTRYGAGTHPRPLQADPEPVEQPVLGPIDGSRLEERRDEKPEPVELTPAGRRIRENLEHHWHDPAPRGAPVDSTHHGRSPPE